MEREGWTTAGNGAGAVPGDADERVVTVGAGREELDVGLQLAPAGEREAGEESAAAADTTELADSAATQEVVVVVAAAAEDGIDGTAAVAAAALLDLAAEDFRVHAAGGVALPPIPVPALLPGASSPERTGRRRGVPRRVALAFPRLPAVVGEFACFGMSGAVCEADAELTDYDASGNPVNAAVLSPEKLARLTRAVMPAKSRNQGFDPR
jgi:hypothetical protein